MRWFDHDEVLKRLASEYVLGTLQGPARRHFEKFLKTPHSAAGKANRYVGQWQEYWLAEELKLPEVEAPKALWAGIEQRMSHPLASSTVTPYSTPKPGLADWFLSLFRPVTIGALALGLALGVLVPKLLQVNQPLQHLALAQLPESYVGVLATTKGRTGLIISSLRRGSVLDVKRVTAVDVPTNKTLFLWGIDINGKAFPISEMPDGAFVSLTLKASSEDLFFKANELAVSIEIPGIGPSSPSGEFVYRGLCGKLWKLPPPQAK